MRDRLSELADELDAVQEWTIDKYQEGHSMTEIASAIGLSWRDIKPWLEAAGVAFRDKRKAANLQRYMPALAVPEQWQVIYGSIRTQRYRQIAEPAVTPHYTDVTAADAALIGETLSILHRRAGE